jgi:hypothetical protein
MYKIGWLFEKWVAALADSRASSPSSATQQPIQKGKINE